MSHHRSALILQVVGYQNSGKTSFVSELTKQLSSAGRRVGVIKHHGHGGRLTYPCLTRIATRWLVLYYRA